MPTRSLLRGLCALVLVVLSGCGVAYEGVVRPVPQLNSLSPELEHLTDAAIDTYLKAQVKVSFPTVLAVGKLYQSYRHAEGFEADYVRGEEALGWRSLTAMRGGAEEPLISQVQLISPMLCGSKPTLKGLRDAAALLHAPVLLVYVQVSNAQEGQNEAAMAYWSLVGLFTVPGNTVGHYSVCQALLIDTQSGFILATAQGEAKREENVLPGAVDIARQRLENSVPAEAVVDLQKNARELISALHSEAKSGESTSAAAGA